METPQNSRQEVSKSEKEIQWNRAATFVRQLKEFESNENAKARQNNKEVEEKLARGEMSKDEALDAMQYWQDLDEGVEEILTALNAYGLNTVESCRGHFSNWKEVKENEERIRLDPLDPQYYSYHPSFPRIGVGSGHYPRSKAEIKTTTDYGARLICFVEEFYKSRQNVPDDIRLLVEFRDLVKYGHPLYLTFKGYRELSDRKLPCYIVGDGPIEDELKKLEVKIKEYNEITAARHKEMDDFTAFLKTKFFGQSD